MAAKVSPLGVLTESNPWEKAKKAREFRRAVLGGATVFCESPPKRPARPERPPLVSPRELRRRRLGSPEGRAALLHAIAHIELNAIDLAADMIARFADAPDVAGQRDAFIADWSSVCDDEARHFGLISDRLVELDFVYGDFPAHNGLWDAAMKTNFDIAARLSIAPLVLEARGLDVTPGMIVKLDQAEDRESAAILEIIYEEEVGHVAIGMLWLQHVASHREKDSRTLFRGMVREHFKGTIKPPFNHAARHKAGLKLSFYEDLST
ncbi:rhamnosyltransferase [Algimonas arctica]|uniref:Rhamnosyltransferase n=1 Tax=Algimonas arctica TaxID=1479486 RepID=A0A8J3G1V0_9PROT|nr:ferritin-like domain-containing protein [Algimonas arctica]GHA91155.1 rhamnosyltransferase [Algimonas arctica]